MFDIDATPADAIADTVLGLHFATDAALERARSAMDSVRQGQAYTLDDVAQTLGRA